MYVRHITFKGAGLYGKEHSEILVTAFAQNVTKVHLLAGSSIWSKKRVEVTIVPIVIVVFLEKTPAFY